MTKSHRWQLAVVTALLIAPVVRGATEVVYLGSKAFTESRILGEILTLLVESSGIAAEHRAGLAGTQVAWQALRNGDIDAYVDYTGTIRKEMFPGRDLPSDADLKQALTEQGVAMIPLGFANSYAMGMRRERAEKLGIRTISDLRQHPDLTFGFTNEFIGRNDGWPGLQAAYQLPQTGVKGMEHALAYRALETGSIDAMDLYTTDAKIRVYDIVALRDDRKFFPPYDAVILYRQDLGERAPAALQALLRLAGQLRESTMIELNARVDVDHQLEQQVAADFLRRQGWLQVSVNIEGRLGRLIRTSAQHLFLVGVSLLAAILVAVPLGVVSAHRPRVGQVVLAATGLLQTIPAIALLLLLIPVLNIGPKPTIAALFLYSLLPIVRNTHAGLHNIPASLRESAEALGLSPLAQLRLIELPLASRTILAGIQTAAVINVGTATIGGFVGAGGYGATIFQGIQRGDNAMILEGAIPTAVLALLLQGLFEVAGWFIVPQGLRLKVAA